MKKTKIVMGIVVLAVFVGVFMLNRTPASEDSEKRQGTTQSVEENQNLQDKDNIQAASAVTQEEEHVGLEFPFAIPEYDIEIEAIGSYSGIYVEDGTNDEVSEVAMVHLKNTGTSVVEYAEFQVEFSQEILNFKISALPAGESAAVLEQQRKAVPEDSPKKCTATVVQRDTMGMSENQVSVTDKGANTLEIVNLTEETIPTMRIFYKYYMEEKEMFLGGIAFSVRIADLSGREELLIQPAHYATDSCRIVMVSTYDNTR